MIAGATKGRGGDALIRHLLSQDHQISRPLPARGLLAASFADQVAEMVAMSAAGRTNKPVYHLHVDPPVEFDNDDKIFDRYLELFEIEFGFESQPRVAVEHIKNGRRHRHFAWSLVGVDGRIIDLGHDFARREKISRRIEYEFGMPFVGGRHNRAVMKALSGEGRLDVVEAMLAAGLGDVERPVAATTPAERHQEERTGVKKREVEARAWESWLASQDGAGFTDELKKRGLLLAVGDEGPVMVDMAGGVHSLTRTIGKVSKQVSGSRVKTAVVKARLAGLALEPLEIMRSLALTMQDEPVAQPKPDGAAERMKKSLSGWLKAQKENRSTDERQAIESHKEIELTRNQKIAERVLQVNLTGDYLHADNQLAARLHFVAGQFQIRVHELTTSLPIPEKLAAAKAELARRETILRTYVIARKRYNEAWVAHWRHRPSKLNYLKYVRWYNEAVQMDKERRGLGLQLGRLNPAVHNSRTDVLDREAQFEAEIRIRQSAVRELEAKFAMEVEKETRRRQPAIERLRSEAEVLIVAAEIAERRDLRTATIDQVVELMQEAADKLRGQLTQLEIEVDEHAEIAREAEEEAFEHRPRI